MITLSKFFPSEIRRAIPSSDKKALIDLGYLIEEQESGVSSGKN